MPKLVEAIYGIPAPKGPRNDLVEIFLTGITTKAGGPIKKDLNSQLNNADVDPKKFVASEMLRLNTSIAPAAKPNRLGVLGGDVQGFPNGRRLTDDVLDIGVQALEGAAVNGIVAALATGDKVDANHVAFGHSFPYVALPNNAGVNTANSGSGFVPISFGGPDMPLGPLLNGLLAAVLIGSGAWLLRHRPQWLPASAVV